MKEVKELSLLSMVGQSQALEQLLLTSNGEITEEIEELLAVKEIGIPAKIDSYHFVMDRMEAVSKFYKERAKMFLDAARSAANAQETIKERLKYAMKEAGVTEILGNDIRFVLSKTKPKLVIDDESIIPKEYKIEIIATELQKDILLEDLKLGEVAGAHLEDSCSLRSYVNGPKTKKVALNE